MSTLLSPLWIEGLIQSYGLWTLFAVVMLESVGLPLPGETALVTAAVYAGATHQLGIAWVTRAKNARLRHLAAVEDVDYRTTRARPHDVPQVGELRLDP